MLLQFIVEFTDDHPDFEFSENLSNNTVKELKRAVRYNDDDKIRRIIKYPSNKRITMKLKNLLHEELDIKPKEKTE